MTSANPPTPASAPVARLLESALAGLECGADGDELTEALRSLGQPIDVPPSHEAIERLFCECWNALYALGLRPEWIEPEPEPEPENESEPESAPCRVICAPSAGCNPATSYPDASFSRAARSHTLSLSPSPWRQAPQPSAGACARKPARGSSRSATCTASPTPMPTWQTRP